VNLRVGNLDVLADDVRVDDPQPVFVLKEPTIRRVQIGRMAAADDFEGRHLRHRGVEARLVGHHLHRLVLKNGAGQHDGEGLADPHGAGAGPPPAPNRIDFDVLAFRRGRRLNIKLVVSAFRRTLGRLTASAKATVVRRSFMRRRKPATTSYEI
jgi:hypothetical protein